jgi:hypothetical protein
MTLAFRMLPVEKEKKTSTPIATFKPSTHSRTPRSVKFCAMHVHVDAIDFLFVCFLCCWSEA